MVGIEDARLRGHDSGRGWDDKGVRLQQSVLQEGSFLSPQILFLPILWETHRL